MTNGLYDPIETDSALEALKEVALIVGDHMVLLGGWAVFLTVNESYRAAIGRDYLGSKDVDLGFQIDPTWTIDELKASSFSLALKVIEECGYYPSGTSRYCKIIDKNTNEVLDERAASKVPLHDLFYLYLDPIVDIVHPQHEQVFTIKPIDEPLLTKAFSDRSFKTIQLGPSTLQIPDAQTLLATKLAAFPNRDREHKRIKDACDIYALLWHSPDNIQSITTEMKSQYIDLVANGAGLLAKDVILDASTHVGVKREIYRDVISQLVK